MEKDLQYEKNTLLRSALYPILFIVCLWLIKGVEEFWVIDLSKHGLAPKSFRGLTGILFYPFLHKDIAHLSSNSVPLFVLGTALFYYYRQSALKIFLQLFFVSGFWLWVIGAKGSIHIGASGLVYALAAFHITSGVIRRVPRQMAFAVLVVFLYGSMVWGIFPDFFPKRNISWEGHLMGTLAGMVLAFFHRDKGPEKQHYSWEDEEGEDDDETPVSGSESLDENLLEHRYVNNDFTNVSATGKTPSSFTSTTT